MKDIYVIYRGMGPRYCRVLVRRVSWFMCHYKNFKIYFKPNFKSKYFWFWNINLLLFATCKCNGNIDFRLLNYRLEFYY